MKPRIFVSFSGGRTSAFMLKWILDKYEHTHNIIVGFANTGQEHEVTLKFVRDVGDWLDCHINWLECVVNPESGAGTTHKIVNFDSAHRGSDLFDAVCAKYGLPGPKFPHCTRELKTNPIKSFIRSLGWKPGTYRTAIGIREDEIDRMDEKAEEKKLWYPLVKLKITKKDIHDFWSKQSINLMLPEHHGNCTWCWKKSLRKHLTNVKENPQFYDCPQMLEARHAFAGPGIRNGKMKKASRLFRSEMTVNDLFAMSKLPFNLYTDEMRDDLDKSHGCVESCEVEF